MSTNSNSAPPRGWLVAASLLCGGVLLYSYWPSLSILVAKWNGEAEYSHGFLVPLFSAYLLWARRDRLDVSRFKPSWWGVGLVVFGLATRLMAVHYYLEWFEFVSLVPTLFGLVLVLGGRPALRWSWPALAFLVFMLPLPFTAEVALRQPLRMVGTKVSTYVMQTCALPAVAEGNVISVNDVRIGVAEACSGLRMLMTFVALSTAVAILGTQPLWHRIVVFLAAGPIAIVSNVVRITVTGLLYAWHFDELADLVFHDLAGWLMMPLALAQLWLLQWWLSKLFVETEVRPLAADLRPGIGRTVDSPVGEPTSAVG